MATVTVDRPNINSLTADQRSALMSEKFTGPSRVQREFGADLIDLDCSPYAQNLRAEVIRVLAAKGVDVPGGELEQLHRHIAPELKRYDFNDGVNKISTFLYDADEAFARQYHRLIKECVRAHFPYPFYFQAIPTVRIQCPGGENSDHYPRYHTDINYGHPPEEINIWIPLTTPMPPQYHGFRSMNFADSRHVLERFNFDFVPFVQRAINDKPFNFQLNEMSPQITTPLGKMLVFDSRCIHTTEPLLGHTRVSIDIRIVPIADFVKMPVEYQGVGRRKIRYLPGFAYDSRSSEDL